MTQSSQQDQKWSAFEIWFALWWAGAGILKVLFINIHPLVAYYGSFGAIEWSEALDTIPKALHLTYNIDRTVSGLWLLVFMVNVYFAVYGKKGK